MCGSLSKALGNNVRFQFILPDELDATIQANKGKPVGKKKQGLPKPALPSDTVIDPTKLALVDGTFRCQGHPVPQLQISQIGPVACGVVLISPEDAAPYLRANAQVSGEPLALVIVSTPAHEVNTSLPHAKVMMPCMCVANQEPLLIDAVIVQLGKGLIEKHVPTSAISFDQLDVASVKIMVYQDEFVGNWDEFLASPIKQLVQKFPLLRRCEQQDCQCECWHNCEGLAVKEPIMDVWRRQFLLASFKPTQASKAVIFSVCLRTLQ